METFGQTRHAPKKPWISQDIQGLQMRVYNASVNSVLLYGSEGWLLNPTVAARFDGFDSRILLRRIEGITWSKHITNLCLRDQTQQLPASCLAAM